MAASRSKRPVPGFSPFKRPSKAIAAGALLTGGNPSGHILEDSNGNSWYYWFDTNGVLRFADAVTVETPGFSFQTGGTTAATTTITWPLLAGSTSTDIWVAPSPYIVTAVRELHSVVGGAAAAVRPRKITDTSAPSAAASATVKEITTAVIDLTAAVNVLQSPALVATPADYTFATGNRLALNFTGTLTGLVGNLTIFLTPIG